MHKVIAEAARRPLVSRAVEVLGTSADPGPIQHMLFDNAINATIWRPGQTGILTNRSGKVRKWECSIMRSGHREHTRKPDEIFQPRREGLPHDYTYRSDALCTCFKVRGAKDDEPISPTQRLLSRKCCTDLSADPKTRDNCTLFFGDPSGLDRTLRASSKLQELAPRPFSSTTCIAEPWCVRPGR